MIKFINEKKKKSITLNSSFLVNTYSSMSSLATYAMKPSGKEWSEVKSLMGVRQQPRNNPMGIVITKPDNDSFLVETVWEDMKSKMQHDGDMTLFCNVGTDMFKFKRLTPEQVKKSYPNWHPYHHEDKSYLK